MVPAFLSYFPDSHGGTNNCLFGIKGLRRIKSKFLEYLISESNLSNFDWQQFFKNAGVSQNLKLLKYKRLVGVTELSFDADFSDIPSQTTFCGDHQNDENRSVVEILKNENLWGRMIANSVLCDHNYPLVLQSLTLIEGLSNYTKTVDEKYRKGEDDWTEMLWSLIKGLPLSSISELEKDGVFCRGGGPGGHAFNIGSYLQLQLEHYNWLPSTLGPVSRMEAFGRLFSRRLISKGRTDEEIGDKLFPYVIVNSLDDLAKLEGLGIEILDDAESASNTALFRALQMLGERLSIEWGCEEIIKKRPNWRLVRGAIQEIYRMLNQYQDISTVPEGIKFATRTTDGITFKASPLYYAKPGSPLEKAFLGILPLFDSDRPFVKLFDQINVIRLIPDETVTEKFLAEKNSIPAHLLRDEIINNLSPYFLSLIIARSEKAKLSEMILRRIRERFDVKAADNLIVSYSLIDDPSIERTIDFPKFYVQRRPIHISGAIKEINYTLYFTGEPSLSLTSSKIDADALGEALATIFLDGSSEELSWLFPRITSRYHLLDGQKDEMQDFLHCQLGISREALDMGRAMLTGEAIEIEPISPPPPAKIISTFDTNGTMQLLGKQSFEEKIRKHQEHLNQKTNGIVLRLITNTTNERKDEKSTLNADGITYFKGNEGITLEQETRGKKGEEEIKRRLQLPGGWESFKLIADKRKQGCGYDFLCIMGGNDEVEIEVKTFTRDGHIVVTSRELQEAATSNDGYFLVGVLDNGGPENEWKTYIRQNPIDILLMKGEFDIDTRLQSSANEIFDLEDL